VIYFDLASEAHISAFLVEGGNFVVKYIDIDRYIINS
jgi:hypothetical protein